MGAYLLLKSYLRSIRIYFTSNLRLVPIANLANKIKNTEMATYEEIKDIPNHPEVYLIDVRDHSELQSTGVIPGSLNIPMSELEAALVMEDNDFKNAFNRPKPNKDTAFIFSCMAGGRAQRATDLAKARGFTNVKPYPGSWKEWAAKEGLPS